jgi:hypothetical protein
MQKKKNLLLACLILAASHLNGQCPPMSPFIQAVPNTIFPVNGSCNGSFVLDPVWINGTPPYTYTTNFGTIIYDYPNPGWASVYGLCAGQNVSMSITDANGCTGVDNLTMVEPPPVNPVITLKASCNSLPNGSVTVSNIPSWYFERTVFISTSNACTGLSDPCPGILALATLNSSDQGPYVVSGLQPGNYYFGISFQFTNEISPWYGPVQFVPFTIQSAQYPGAQITPVGATSFCNGGNVLLKAPVNANYAYQWKKNGTAIPGAVTSSYTATGSGAYKVAVTNSVSGCAKTSSTATQVTVYSNPVATIAAQAPVTFCSGDSVQLKANFSSSYTYQWKKNNANITGATTHKYTAKTAGSFRVKETSSNGCTALSSTIAVSVPCRDASADNVKGHDEPIAWQEQGSDDFIIQLPYDKYAPSFKLIDITGRMIAVEITGESESAYRLKWSGTGMFVLLVENNNRISYLKLVKQH